MVKIYYFYIFRAFLGLQFWSPFNALCEVSLWNALKVLVRVSEVHNSFFIKKNNFCVTFFSKKTLYYISSSLIYYYCCNVISQEGGWYLIWMTLENHYNTISYLALVGSSTEVFDSEEPAEERFFFDKFLLVLLIKNASSDWDRVELAHPKITFKVRLFQKWCNFFSST